MSEIKWIKIVTDIFDDEKILLIETLPEGDSIIVLWFKLLCLSGKQNNSGVFAMQNGMPYTDKMLSIIFRRKEATVKLALDTFKTFGMIEIIEDAITIPNWSKHQNFDKIETRNAYMREYMKDKRERQKLIASGKTNTKNAENRKVNSKVNSKANSKPNVSDADKIRLDKIRKEKEYSPEFEKFWSLYPCKKGKGDAARKFKAAMNIVSLEAVLEAVKAYCNSKTVKGGFICNPATWLHQERWNDEISTEQTPANIENEIERLYGGKA